MDNYNREESVKYALKHWNNPNGNYKVYEDNDCTNFVSQCLKAGGCNNVYDTYPWWYSKGTNSKSWSVAHSLYWCLKNRYHYKLSGLKGKEVDRIEELDLGDIIQYENDKGRIYHSAIITYKSQDFKKILITQRTYNLNNVSHKKENAKAHYIKILNS